MTSHILYCSKCKIYTLKANCPVCSVATAEKKPPKYSPEDKYGRYRREVKKEELKEQGVI